MKRTTYKKILHGFLAVTAALLLPSLFSLRGASAYAQEPSPSSEESLTTTSTVYYFPDIQRDSVRLSYVVSGNVRDAESGDPLPYVTVSIPGSHFSTVTNEDGDFTIKSGSQPQRIMFSLIGYKTLSQALTQTGDNQISGLRVRMSLDPITLKEAVIIADDPYEILQKAIKLIEKNYPSVPELMDCFYRETVQKRTRYIYISEAVTKLYKTKYGDRNTFRDRTAISKSRVLLSPKTSDTLSVKVLGGPNQSISLDAVKNEDFILNEEELSLYSIEMGRPVMIDGRAQYAINIAPHAETDYALQTGTFYVDRETLAFTRVELSLDMSDEEKATKAMLVRKPASLRFRPRELSLMVNYRTEEGVTRISYVRCTMRFTCDWKKKLLRGTSFTAVNEMVVTNRHEGDIELITRGESFRDNESLFDKSGLYLDPEFWKDYNIIEPSESLEHALGRLKRQSTRR